MLIFVIKIKAGAGALARKNLHKRSAEAFFGTEPRRKAFLIKINSVLLKLTMTIDRIFLIFYL